MIEIAQSLVLALCFLLFLKVPPGRLYGFNHYVACCMLEACKLNESDVVSSAFQLKGSEAVCKLFGQPVFKNTMPQHGLVKIIFYLAEKFMLTAWYT